MPSPPLLLMDDRNGVCDPAAAACGGGAEERAAAAAAEAGGGYEFGLEQVAAYLTACCLLWVAVIVLLRVVVFRKSARIPVFRITPDRRDVIEDMESTEWMQAVVNKAFHALKADADPDELMQAITHAVNKVLHLSGGKFELHSLDIGDAPPQLCGVEARRAGGGDHRHEYLLDLFYQGGLSACFGVEHPVDLPLLGTSMFPVKVFIQSLELQLRLKVIWDAAAHHAPPPPPGEQAKPAAKPSQLHPDPARKSTLEISLANIPDISMRMSTELGARHVIADSQFLTSLLAVCICCARRGGAAARRGRVLMSPTHVLSLCVDDPHPFSFHALSP
eukprot:TRINITY_DN2617_c2_g1_i2.p1 TRINITY_DN2617_c2_g1~~TRINITY_DN2617_c2_g1_i2.p1  ORF type:complete len:333 (+),score=104.45 TRINITY_DN2617_c2_g1_i2:109-1107(+)